MPLDPSIFNQLEMPRAPLNPMDLERDRLANTALQQKSVAGSLALHREALVNVTDPTQTAKWIRDGFNDRNLSPILQKAGSPEEIISRIPQDPKGFADWIKRNALGLEKYYELTMKPQKSGSSPMQQRKFDKQISDDFKSTGQAMQTMAEITNAIKTVRASKGLSAREGYTGYIPSLLQGPEAMSAQNRIETLKGKVTQMGKAMATMSGAIGPMAVQEWKIVADAINAIDPTAGNLEEQLSNIEAQAMGASERIKDSYDRTYENKFENYPQFETGNIRIYPSTTSPRSKPTNVPLSPAPTSPPPQSPSPPRYSREQIEAELRRRKVIK